MASSAGRSRREDDEPVTPRVAIIDYGMGNLFSVGQACRAVELEGVVTSDAGEIQSADAVILPGVGAFGTAMGRLRSLGLVEPLRELAQGDKPLIGICLGFQLLMSESEEFGAHEGLGILAGSVERLGRPREGESILKTPHVGWSRVQPAGSCADDWAGTLMESVEPGEFMYFVHSYVVRPADGELALTTTRYGSVEFCSAINYRNVFACQFHPERSGRVGLGVYRNLARRLGL